MKQVQFILLGSILFGIISFSCKKDEVITPPEENPGKQRDIEWPSLAKSAWPMAHHDPQSTGRSPYIGLPEGRYRWSRLGFPSWGSVAIDVDGTIYYESDDSINARALIAVSSDGILKWKTRISPPSVLYIKNHTTIMISSLGIIYLISRDGKLYAVKRDGSIAWSFSADADIISKGLTIGLDGSLYFVSKSGLLYSIGSDGQTKWTKIINNGFYKSSSGPQIVFSPDGKNLYVSGELIGLYALDLSGNVLWSNESVTNYYYSARLIDSDGNIYVHIGDTIVCFSSNGKIRWENGKTKGSTGFAIDYDGNLYCCGIYPITSNDVRLISFDYNGKIRWTYKIDGAFVGDLVCDKEGTVFFGSSGFDTKYYAIKNDGSIKWIINHGLNADFSASPAIANDGSIYAGSGGGGTGGDNGLFKFR